MVRLVVVLALVAASVVDGFTVPLGGALLRRGFASAADGEGSVPKSWGRSRRGAAGCTATATLGEYADNEVLMSAREAFVSAALAGPKNGVAATPEERADIEGKLNALVALNPTQNPADKLVGEWETFLDGSFKSIYTNTTGASNGKVGPFVGDVWQQFVTARDSNTGVVTNNLKLGPLRGQLTARCERKSETKMDVLFEKIVFKLFGVPISTKEFGPDSKDQKKEPKGSWKLRYMDKDLRILITNAGNVESLLRTTEFDGM